MRSISYGHENSEAKQLMQWVKGLVYSPRCHKLKDLSDGVVWCRLMGKLRPGTLASVLIINRPANVNDSMHNYMLLESAFGKANIPWYFDTGALIAGDSNELLRMAKCFAELSTTRETAPMSHPVPPFKASRQTRRPAGEHESQRYLSSPQPSAEVGAVELTEIAGQPQPDDDQPPSPTGDVLQLKQQIQAMFRNQQAAVKAYLAEEQPITPTHPQQGNTMCFCSKCQNQGQDVLDIKSIIEI
ncbi:uncharacterized protein LOC111601926 [Drosophila hydei]|uniref:Uncharacterized protein LOC111601926 n=1 Tax=Drosophila hydei TaxID=7224 RepID=A0A6J1M5X4_DROHY|nr:uncharacterized protein LOC111601926 [Drosophila hydei]